MTTDNTNTPNQPSGSLTPLEKSERFDYERLKKLEIRGIEALDKYRKTKPPSIEHTTWFIHQLSPWNIERGEEAIEFHIESQITKLEAELLEGLPRTCPEHTVIPHGQRGCEECGKAGYALTQSEQAIKQILKKYEGDEM